MISKTAELFDLTGKTAIVTASGQGLGQGIAYRLADAGANIVVSHKYIDTAEQTAAEIRQRGGKAVAVLTDVTDIGQIDDTVAAALEAFGGIDILVNNAGGMHQMMPFVDVTPEIWTATIERNYKGTYFMTQRVVKHMIAAATGGRIVNIASTAAFKPDFHLAAYNGSKAAVVTLAQSLASELAPYGILINTVAPGPVRTDKTAAAYDHPGTQEFLRKVIPVGTACMPDDIAAAVLFCVSPASGHMTGGTMVIDGGYMWGLTPV